MELHELICAAKKDLYEYNEDLDNNIRRPNEDYYDYLTSMVSALVELETYRETS